MIRKNQDIGKKNRNDPGKIEISERKTGMVLQIGISERKTENRKESLEKSNKKRPARLKGRRTGR